MGTKNQKNIVGVEIYLKNSKRYNPFKLSGDLQREYEAEITSFLPSFILSSAGIETFKGKKRFNENDVNLLVVQTCKKYSIFNNEPQFGFQISVQAKFGDQL